MFTMEDMVNYREIVAWGCGCAALIVSVFGCSIWWVGVSILPLKGYTNIPVLGVIITMGVLLGMAGFLLLVVALRMIKSALQNQ